MFIVIVLFLWLPVVDKINAEMDPFSVEEFVKEPSLRVINSLKKPQLIEVGTYYKLEVDASMKKGEVKRLLVEFLIDEEIIPEDEENSGVTPLSNENDLELRRLELQDKEKEREAQLKLKELELREKELSVQLRLKELETPASRPPVVRSASETKFDISKQIRFVPPFQEREVDKYFLHFEKIATSLEWPRDVWTLLLQSVLVGKAREIYSSMSVEESSQYDHVKTTILKAYELVPEAYRQHFRSSRKQDTQTFTEFAREKEVQFDRWCSAKEVAQDFSKLRQLMLLEEFKSCLTPQMKTYLDERKVDVLSQAAALADDYSLTHKNNFAKPELESAGGRNAAQGRQPTTGGNNNTNGQRLRSENVKRYHNNSGGGTWRSNVPVCFYCKRKGHIMSECWELEKKKAKSNAVVNVKRDGNNLVTDQSTTTETAGGKEVNSFISEGHVSLTAGADPVPIRILRDTGATQSLLAENILPLSDTTSMGTHVLIQGVELGILRVPLHRVHLKSDLVSGAVVVGVRPTLPIPGVSLILGNDLAGEKVIPDLQVMNENDSMSAADMCVDDIPEVFSSCAITRAMAKHTRDEESTESLVNLGDTFLAHSDDISKTLEDRSRGESETLNCPFNDQDITHPIVEREQLMREQENDPELRELAKDVVSNEDVTTTPECFFMQSGILMRKWRPRSAPATDEWRTACVPDSSTKKEAKRCAKHSS